MKRISLLACGLVMLIALAFGLAGCYPEDIGGNPVKPSDYGPIRGLWFGQIRNITRDETWLITLELEEYPATFAARVEGHVRYFVRLPTGDVVPVFYTTVTGTYASSTGEARLYWEDLGRNYSWSCRVWWFGFGDSGDQHLDCTAPNFQLAATRSKEEGWARPQER
jgi:hypothetical protein